MWRCGSSATDGSREGAGSDDGSDEDAAVGGPGRGRGADRALSAVHAGARIQGLVASLAGGCGSRAAPSSSRTKEDPAVRVAVARAPCTQMMTRSDESVGPDGSGLECFGRGTYGSSTSRSMNHCRAHDCASTSMPDTLLAMTCFVAFMALLPSVVPSADIYALEALS